MTTAGGDGLSFMIGQPNIFELVEAQKEGRDLLEGPSEEIQKEGNATEETTETDQEEEEEVEKVKKPFNDIDFTSLEELPE